MSATGSAGVFTFESPCVVNHVARAFRMRSCSVLSVFPTIRSTSQRLHHKDIRESGDTVPPKRGPSNRPRGPSLLPTRSIARPVHERTWRHRRRTREDQGRGPHGRNLWSRHDGPWTQPDHPVHHRPRKPAAPGPRGHRDRSPDLCAELRHGRGLLGRSSCWIPNRETHGSDVHLAQQHLPPLRRSPPAHDGPSRTSPLRAADHRGLRAQSPRHPDFHVPDTLVRHAPSSSRGGGPQRPLHLAGPPPDAHGTWLLRGGHPGLLRQPDPQPRGLTCSTRCSSSSPAGSIDFGGARKSSRTDRPYGTETTARNPPQTFEPRTPPVKVGSRQRASIPRPAGYETAALPG